MPSFEIVSVLEVKADRLAKDVLTMEGVNYELSPWLQMSAPEEWQTKPIKHWPINREIFKSWIRLFGFIPVDLHVFKLIETSEKGIKECSSSIINKYWKHDRTILKLDAVSTVRDSLEFHPRLYFLRFILKPLYKSVFIHRHYRLKQKYGIVD